MSTDKEIRKSIRKEKRQKVRQEMKPKNKLEKSAVIIGIVLLVLFLLTIAAKCFIVEDIQITKTVKISNPFYDDYLFMILPETTETVFDDKEMTLYIERNEDFDKTKNDALERFKVYYYKDNDTSTKKIYLTNGSTLKGEKESSNLMVLQFVGNALITDNIIRTTLNNISIVLWCLFGAYLIFFWYLNWSRRYDKNKESNTEANKE